ncbi:MAG TPA: hypothetical protein VMU06_16610 [Stellaceae bacterium]|nr:hypothetical protein [Stellaceae bacterium]
MSGSKDETDPAQARQAFLDLPTITLLRWQPESSGEPNFAPLGDVHRHARAHIALELAMIPVVLVCAAAMARYGSL